MKKICLLLLSGLSFISCNHYPETMPKDFNFSLSFGYFEDIISTYDSTYRGEGTFKIIFSQAEKNRIYKTLVANDYLSLPDEFSYHSPIAPHPTYFLIVTESGRKKSIFLDGYYGDGPDFPDRTGSNYKLNRTIRRFAAIVTTIENILDANPEFKKIPPDHRLAL